MNKVFYPKIQRLTVLVLGLILGIGFFYCPNLWAYQDALVTSEKALVCADEQMTSPLGFIRKGKRIKVGNIPRNKAQVYPIIVSGKMAFIRVLDISTEKESVTSQRLVAERFQKATEIEYKTRYAFSYFSYASQIKVNHQNSELKNTDPLTWNGLGLKGELVVNPRWDFQILGNFLQGEVGSELYRVYELGLGASFRLYEKGKFIVKLDGQFLAVPFANYEVGTDFRVNGYGFSTGGAMNVSYHFTSHWGLEMYGGLYYTKLLGFGPPNPYEAIDPSFAGTRLGLGATYQF